MEIERKRLRISPVQLGARPVPEVPDRWVLAGPDREEMTITCTDAEGEVFTLTVQIARLLAEGQSYQLAAALTLNHEVACLNGGAVAYDVDDDTFLYCKRVEARTLDLSAFNDRIARAFSTARLLRERLAQAQGRIRPATAQAFQPKA